MKHQQGLGGRWVRLAQDARWRNFGEANARIMPKGSVLRLESWRPEGYCAVTEKGEYFFLFARYLETAEEVFMCPDCGLFYRMCDKAGSKCIDCASMDAINHHEAEVM